MSFRSNTKQPRYVTLHNYRTAIVTSRHRRQTMSYWVLSPPLYVPSLCVHVTIFILNVDAAAVESMVSAIYELGHCRGINDPSDYLGLFVRPAF